MLGGGGALYQGRGLQQTGCRVWGASIRSSGHVEPD